MLDIMYCKANMPKNEISMAIAAFLYFFKLFFSLIFFLYIILYACVENSVLKN